MADFTLPAMVTEAFDTLCMTILIMGFLLMQR
ncbi:unknown [Prevotella sp. CAG:1320]|nr:unknown [Prevotella sp. CAG:1320]